MITAEEMAAAVVIYCVIIAAITGATGQQVDVEPEVYSYPRQTVGLSCVVNDTGVHITRVAWFYGRTPIATLSSAGAITYPNSPVLGRVSFSPSPPNLTSPSIQISDVKETDEGNYTCSVSLSTGVKEGITYLEVLERIVDASVKPSTKQPLEGNSVNLTCEAAGSVFTRKWTKNEADLTESDNIMFYNEGRVLSFLSLNKTDSGEYSCNISNPVSSVEVQYNMDVIFGPDNVQIQGPSNLSLNEILTLTCFAESTPPPAFTWKLNERASSIHSAVLKKRITDVSDGGKYICEVMNSITGRNSSAVHELTVLDKTPSPCPAGCIAGIVIGCLVLIAVCVVLFVLYKKNRDRQNSQRQTELQQRSNRDTPQKNTEEEYENTHPVYETIN